SPLVPHRGGNHATMATDAGPPRPPGCHRPLHGPGPGVRTVPARELSPRPAGLSPLPELALAGEVLLVAPARRGVGLRHALRVGPVLPHPGLLPRAGLPPRARAGPRAVR